MRTASAVGLLAAAPVAAACPAGPSPADAWSEPPAPTEAVERLLGWAFDPAERSTDGLVVIHDGRLVAERYANGFDRDRRHIAWSMSKSVLHAVYGAAVQEGVVDLDRPVTERSPWIGDGTNATITYRDLLRMSSGLGFREQYEFAPLRSSVIAMLYTRGRADMARFAAGHEPTAEPGAAWAYKSGDSLILASALRDVVGADRYEDYPWTALFEPLGIRSATWERDASGTFVGSSYLYASPRDLARIGQLYLDDGCWGGRPILPEGWLGAAGMPAPALDQPLEPPWWAFWIEARAVGYGEHWWLNRAADGTLTMPDAPADTLIASGHWGQRMIVVPSLRLVAVRLADDKGGGWSNAEFLRLLTAAVGAGG